MDAYETREMRCFDDTAGEERGGYWQQAAVHECIGPYSQAEKVSFPKEGKAMKKQSSFRFALVLVLGIGTAILLSGCSELWSPAELATSGEGLVATMAKKGGCVTIQDGAIYDSTGELITTGYDRFGYNYQAHLFNGRYCDYDRVVGGDFCDVNLSMKWNDAWMSNKDCDGDGLLDRHFGFDSYIGSGAWLTNHQSGTYAGEDGKEHRWTYFVKIVAAPEDAYATAGIWYAADGTEIGPAIWGAFAIIQQVENDPEAGIHGIQYRSPAGPSLGKW